MSIHRLTAFEGCSLEKTRLHHISRIVLSGKGGMYASMTSLIGKLVFRSTYQPRREIQDEIGGVVSTIHSRLETRDRS